MSYPRDHPMRPDSPIVECPHCGKRYPAEDGPVCVRCGGRLSKYNTRAVVIPDHISHETIYSAVKVTQDTIYEDWLGKEVITFGKGDITLEEVDNDSLR